MDSAGNALLLEVWENVWRYWAVVGFKSVICIVLALVASGEIVIQAFPPFMAGLALIIMPAQLARSIYRGSKITFSRPLIVLSPEGIQHQGLSASLGWRAISKINKVNRARTSERTLKIGRPGRRRSETFE